MKWTDKNGHVRNITKIETQEDVDYIIKKGSFGTPQIGAYSEYLGFSDGGYAIYSADEVEGREQEQGLELD